MELEPLNFVDNSSFIAKVKQSRKFEKQSTQLTQYSTSVRPSIDANGPATVTGIKEMFKRSAINSAMTSMQQTTTISQTPAPSHLPVFNNPEFVTCNDDYRKLMLDARHRLTNKNSPRVSGADFSSEIHHQRSSSVARTGSAFNYSNLRVRRNNKPT